MTYIHVSPILGAPLQFAAFAVCLVPSLGSPGSLAQPSSLRVAAKPPDREEDPPTRWMRTKYRRYMLIVCMSVHTISIKIIEVCCKDVYCILHNYMRHYNIPISWSLTSMSWSLAWIKMISCKDIRYMIYIDLLWEYMIHMVWFSTPSSEAWCLVVTQHSWIFLPKHGIGSLAHVL